MKMTKGIELDRDAYRDLYLCREAGWCPAAPIVVQHFQELVRYDRCRMRWTITHKAAEAMARYQAHTAERRALVRVARGNQVRQAVVTELNRKGLIRTVTEKSKLRPTGLTDRGLRVLMGSRGEK